MLAPKRLAVLREFAARGTVAGAAEALAFTPSAVSQQLAQLQREAGVELFRKTGRRLELTDAGRTLVARADDLLAHLERVEAELATHGDTIRGTVRVAAFQTVARALVLPALDRLRHDHPHLEVELYESEAEASLPAAAAGAYDVALAEEYEHAPRPHMPQLHREYLDPDEMVLVLARGHAAAEATGAVALADLSVEPWATNREGTAFGDMVARLCRSVGGFEPDVRYRVSDFGLLLDLVAAGRAVALVPAIGQPERDPRVVVREIEGGPFTRAIFAAVRASDRQRPATAAVVDAIRATPRSPAR